MIPVYPKRYNELVGEKPNIYLRVDDPDPELSEQHLLDPRASADACS